MKAIDTPILLGLLRGAPEGKALAKSLAGEEIATTEVNMLELRAVAARGGTPTRLRREEALERLRRRITVLPVDNRSVEAAARLAGGRWHEASIATWLLLGALEAHGCSELITRRGAIPTRKYSFRVRLY
jgi:predicted nucleic acid-binding protein